MKFYAFAIFSVVAYLQVQVQAGPINAPEQAAGKTAAPASVERLSHTEFDGKTDANDIDDETNDDDDDEADEGDDDNDVDNVDDSETDQPLNNEHETTTSNTSHLFDSTPKGSTSSVTPNLDAFMRAFEAIDQNAYNEIESFLENIVPKLPENNNPITNHLESAVFLFELYEKMKEPRDLNNSQEQNFLSEIENFLASNSFLLFNKPTAGRRDLEEELTADQNGDEQNQEFELNDDLQDNNQEETTNDEDMPEKQYENENEENKIEPQENNKASVAA